MLLGLSPGVLVIGAGILKRTIPYESITAVRHSSGSRCAFALSLDRVLIEYASGEQLIAPADEQIISTIWHLWLPSRADTDET